MTALFLGILGAIVGSFIAVVVVRWPSGETPLRGRSRCDGCDRTLQARELIPILSALLLRGRCRTCGTPIAAVHWRIEATALAIGAAAGGLARAPSEAGAGALFGWLLLALAGLDLTAFFLPDILTFATAALGLLGAWIEPSPSFVDRLIGGCVGFGSLWAVDHIYQRIRGRRGLGGGDPKLFGAIGCWLGWSPLPSVLLGAALLGLALALAQHMRGRTIGLEDRLPFGAMLAAAAFVAWLDMHGGGGPN